MFYSNKETQNHGTGEMIAHNMMNYHVNLRFSCNMIILLLHGNSLNVTWLCVSTSQRQFPCCQDNLVAPVKKSPCFRVHDPASIFSDETRYLRTCEQPGSAVRGCGEHHIAVGGGEAARKKRPIPRFLRYNKRYNNREKGLPLCPPVLHPTPARTSSSAHSRLLWRY